MHVPHARATAVLAALAMTLAATGAFAQKRQAAPSAPRAHNRFITVNEFIRAKRPGGTSVSVEGYFVTVLRSGTGAALCALVDGTDKVLSPKDADATARTGASCRVALGGKGRPRWSMTRKGLLSLAMYTGSSKAAAMVQDVPPRVRVTGTVGQGGRSITVTRLEYQDFDGEWRDFR